MKYAIFGVNRVTKDFLYIFDELDISLLFYDTGEVEKCSYFIQLQYSIEELGSMRHLFDKIIVCGFDFDEKILKLQSMGLVEGTDFYRIEDFIDSLSEEQLNPDGRRVVLWGTGQLARKYRVFYGIEDVEFFIDTYKTDKYWVDSEKRIVSPNDISEWKDYFVIIAIARSKDVVSYLDEKGLKHGVDYCLSSEWMMNPSRMLKKTIYDRNQYDVMCKTYFSHIELDKNGALNGCCVPFVTGGYGNINENDFEDIWNGLQHKIMCLSVNNRTYSFCDSHMCPVFIGRNSESETELDRPYISMDKRPKNLLMNFEESCNLMCESCRDHVKIATGDEEIKNDKYADFLINKILPYSEFVVMAGTGEVFVGKGYRKIIGSFVLGNVKWLRLLTNGILFNEKNWKTIKNNTNAKVILTVSIDAATKETYEIVRRGGSFDVLKRNMEYAAELRKRGELAYFRLNFVVQKKNYKEIPLFVKWGLELGADEVFFTKILNYGTYSQEEFNDISMYEEGNMIPKKELLEILDDPIMKERIVDLGTIRYNHDPIDVDSIDNYYRWELERKVPGLFGSP